MENVSTDCLLSDTNTGVITVCGFVKNQFLSFTHTEVFTDGSTSSGRSGWGVEQNWPYWLLAGCRGWLTETWGSLFSLLP